MHQQRSRYAAAHRNALITHRAAKKRVPDTPRPEIDGFRARHLALGQRSIETAFGVDYVAVDESESPLAWLANRRGGDRRRYVEPHQLQAGERLRADFTLSHLMPRTTSNWGNPVSSTRGSIDIQHVTGAMVAARQSVHRVLDAVGPEFSGLLLDICCFLKRLEDVGRERLWPPRSAKVVLQLALDRLARHYGYAAQVSGRTRAETRAWQAEESEFNTDGR